MVCSNCALELDAGATVCPRCGTTVANDVAVDANGQFVAAPQNVNAMTNNSQVMANDVNAAPTTVQPNPGVVDITQPVPVVDPNIANTTAPQNVGVSVPNVNQTATPNPVPQAPNPAPQVNPGVVDITQPVPVVDPNMANNPAPQVQTQPNMQTPDVNQMVSNMRVDSVMPTASMGKLNIIRKKSFVGCIIPFTVSVDGTVLGKLNNNTTLSFDLSFGQHQISLKSTGKSVDQVIDLSSNQLICDMKISPRFGLITAVPKVTEISYRNQ